MRRQADLYGCLMILVLSHYPGRPYELDMGAPHLARGGAWPDLPEGQHRAVLPSGKLIGLPGRVICQFVTLHYPFLLKGWSEIFLKLCVIITILVFSSTTMENLSSVMLLDLPEELLLILAKYL